MAFDSDVNTIRNNKSYSRDVFWSALATFTNLGGNFVLTLVTARLMGVSDFGVFAFAQTVCGLIFQLCDPRLQDPLIKFLPAFLKDDAPEKSGRFFLSILLCDLLSGIFAYIATVVVAYLIFIPVGFPSNFSQIMCVSGLSYFVHNFCGNTLTGLVRVFGLYKQYAIAAIVGVFTASAFVAGGFSVLPTSLMSVSVIVVGYSAVIFLVQLICVAYFARVFLASTWASRRGVLLFETIKGIKKFIVENYIAALLAISLKEVDVILLGYAVNPALLGSYKLSKLIYQGVCTLLDPLYFVMYPHFCNLRAYDRGAVRGFLRAVVMILASFSIFFPCLHYWGSEYVVRAMGESFEVVEPGVHLIFTLGLVLWPLFLWVRPIAMAFDRTSPLLRSQAIVTVLVFAVSPFVILSLGASGAAIMTLVSVSAPSLILLFSFISEPLQLDDRKHE